MLQQLWGQTYLIPADITGDELLRYPDDGYTSEVYEGILVKTGATPQEGVLYFRVSFELGQYVQNNHLPNLVLPNVLFDLTPAGTTKKTLLAPDVSVMRPGMEPVWTITRDIPLIAVEIVGPSQTLDEIRIKAAFYRKVGVDEVWMIDTNTQNAEIWNAQGQTQLSATQSLTSTLLPGFSVILATLFP